MRTSYVTFMNRLAKKLPYRNPVCHYKAVAMKIPLCDHMALKITKECVNPA